MAQASQLVCLRFIKSALGGPSRTSLLCMSELSMRQQRALRLSRLSVGFAAALSPWGVTAATPDNSPDSVSLSAVTVTAAKRSQASDKLSGSVSVVTSEQLDDAGVRDTGDLARVLPGVQIANGSSLLFPTISLRGVTSAQDFYNPALTFYIDGVPQMPTMAMQTLTDVDRVELLRGPQGTLYGKSAQGGIVDIITRKPDETATGLLDVGVASRDGFHAKGQVSGALVDDLLYGSMTLLSQSQPGNLYNPATGTNHLGGSKSEAGTARLRLAPKGRPWEINLNLAGECTRAYQDTYLPFDDYRRRTIWSSGDAPDPRLRRCSHSESLSGSYETDDWMLTAVSSWQRLHYSDFYAWDVYANWQPERWKQTVQELRLATKPNGRSWDAVIGLYHQQIDQHRDASFAAYVPGQIPLPVSHGHSQIENLAAYADGTWHLTSKFNLGAGVRVSHDQASTQFSQTATYQAVPGIPPLFEGQGTRQRNHVLGQLSSGYQIRPDLYTYVRIAQGYKPTGFNLAPASAYDATPFGAETSLNYELGVHYEHRDIALQAAVFRTQTKAMQLYTGILGYQTITNAGKSQANGAEFDATWHFAPTWTAGVDGAVTSARFNKFDYSDTVSYTGHRLPFVPRYTAGLHVQGTVVTAVGNFRPGMDVHWVGSQWFDLANTLRQPAYTTIDVRLGWSPTDRVEFTAYAQNLSGRRYRTFAIDSGFSGPIAQANLGRTLGLDMRVNLF